MAWSVHKARYMKTVSYDYLRLRYPVSDPSDPLAPDLSFCLAPVQVTDCVQLLNIDTGSRVDVIPKSVEVGLRYSREDDAVELQTFAMVLLEPTTRPYPGIEVTFGEFQVRVNDLPILTLTQGWALTRETRFIAVTGRWLEYYSYFKSKNHFLD